MKRRGRNWGGEGWIKVGGTTEWNKKQQNREKEKNEKEKYDSSLHAFELYTPHDASLVRLAVLNAANDKYGEIKISGNKNR